MLLHHGTTRRRAESIVRNGPGRNPRETGIYERAWGFSAAIVGEECESGPPERYARGKAEQAADEGGPVILEIDVPEDVMDAALVTVGEVRFEMDCGLPELLQSWPTLPKRIIELPASPSD